MSNSDDHCFEDIAALFVEACEDLGLDLDAELARMAATTDSQGGRVMLMQEAVLEWIGGRQAKLEDPS